MKLLEEINLFPAKMRETLQSRYGISSAEAFYDHASKNPAGMGKALSVSDDELTRLLRLAESHLDPEFVALCQKPTVKHPRGVVVKRLKHSRSP